MTLVYLTLKIDREVNDDQGLVNQVEALGDVPMAVKSSPLNHAAFNQVVCTEADPDHGWMIGDFVGS